MRELVPVSCSGSLTSFPGLRASDPPLGRNGTSVECRSRCGCSLGRSWTSVVPTVRVSYTGCGQAIVRVNRGCMCPTVSRPWLSMSWGLSPGVGAVEIGRRTGDSVDLRVRPAQAPAIQRTSGLRAVRVRVTPSAPRTWQPAPWECVGRCMAFRHSPRVNEARWNHTWPRRLNTRRARPRGCGGARRDRSGGGCR